MSFSTPSRVRVLAGFQPKRTINGSLGTGNGVNVTFIPVAYTFFVSPFNDVPQASDIIVRVSGSTVGIASITESVVVLSAAPADDAPVTADYWGHNLSNVLVQATISEVDAEILGALLGMYTYAQLATAPIIGKISSYLSAAALSDIAYNEAGANTVGQQFPPERLRRVAYALLNEIRAGTISLVDGNNVEIPIIDEIEGWMAETSYGGRDRLFENDQFYTDEEGILTRYKDGSAWRWDPDAAVTDSGLTTEES